MTTQRSHHTQESRQAGTPDVAIRVVATTDEFEDLQRGWDALVEREFDGHPLLRHFWFWNYYHCYFAGQPLRIIVAEHQSELIGIIPLVVTKQDFSGFSLPSACLIAGPESHVNRLLLSPECNEFLIEMLDLALRGVRLLYLEDLPETSATCDRLTDYADSRGLPLARTQVRFSPYIDTSGDFEDYFKGLSKNFRRVLRARRNKINKSFDYNVRILTDGADAARAVADVKAISSNSWQGQEGTGVFGNPANAAFFEALIDHSLKNGYGKVAVLYVGETPAAFEFHCQHREIEYCLKAEMSRDFADVSAGGVLDLEMVERAFESGTEIYDLLGYDDEYKLRWTKLTQAYNRYFLYDSSLKSRLVYFLHHVLRPRVKHNRAARWIYNRVV